ncbi:MAG: hypothetical protein ACP5UO_02070 [Thermoplasmata archaeon]
MNFYPAVLIPLAVFTVLFYLNWNRVDKIVDEHIFARFLLYGLLLGVLYLVLFLYSFLTISSYEDLMLFATLLFLPLLSAGEQLSVLTGKYRKRGDLYQLGSSLGGAFSFPVSFGIAIMSRGELADYFFVALMTVFAFLANVMSGALLARGAAANRTLFFYNLAFLVQMLFSSAIFAEYLVNSAAIYIVLPEILIAALLYFRFFHKSLGTEGIHDS